MPVFYNLTSLVNDMRANGWLIELFNFNFNQRNYFVFVHLYEENESKPQYSLAKFIFIDQNDSNQKLLLHANSRGFLELNVKKFREFFNIPYIEGAIGNAIENFKNHFGKIIPTHIVCKNDNEKEIISNYIDSKRNRNQGMYLSHVRRLNGQRRNPLTDNKAKLLRPDVYRHFESDHTITFCFFTEPEYERTERDILDNFANSRG